MSAKFASKPLVRFGGKVAVLGASLFFGFGLIAYGMAWQKFRATPLWILSSGGMVLNGKIESIQSSGFFKNKDYFIKLENQVHVLMAPATIVNPFWEGGSPATLNLGSLIKKGDAVEIKTSGVPPGGSPVILDLLLKKADGSGQRILEYGTSASRYALTVRKAAEIGQKYILMGIALPVLALLFVILMPRLYPALAPWLGALTQKILKKPASNG